MQLFCNRIIGGVNPPCSLSVVARKSLSLPPTPNLLGGGHVHWGCIRGCIYSGAPGRGQGVKRPERLAYKLGVTLHQRMLAGHSQLFAPQTQIHRDNRVSRVRAWGRELGTDDCSTTLLKVIGKK